MGTLDGKIAFITGGASGLGFATAKRLGSEGATVVIGDRNRELADKAAAELGGRSLVLDVGSPPDWDVAVASLRAEEGALDLLHLNAGVVTPEPDITKVTDDAYRRIMGANVDGVAFGLRACLPLVAEGGGGAVVATSSLAGLIPVAGDPIYAATKHAVIGLVRSLAPQWVDRGVGLSCVCPGIADTPLVGDDTKAALRSAEFPLIAPEAVAEAVYGLMLKRASGEAWVVQAGMDEATPYRFHGVPGPKAKGAEGRRPPGFTAAG